MALNYTVPAVDRAIRVLELLSIAPHGLSLAQLSSQTKVPKSTMFRILHTLHQHQIILEDNERKLFTLGMKVLGWGNAALERIDSLPPRRMTALPVLRQSAAESTVTLGRDS